MLILIRTRPDTRQSGHNGWVGVLMQQHATEQGTERRTD